ncbi:conserved hypothetical protein [Flavobacterium sp. 9AF]|uniref:hypothetical protein n=1 Tax=Flavobacterium sp. 9AF TaxID=2653142 RepID=UPI0012F17A78|nr:hypothetical protein [Flavobacterium sp. 9AF]VXB82951.1 conserved hypothetical protein [Flavobacterium sp. 9AF]
MTGELTVAIKGGLRKSAKEVLEHTDDVKKELDNLVIEENNVKRRLTSTEKIDVIEHLENLGGNAPVSSIVVTKDPIRVKAFIEGLARLEKIKIDNPFDYIKEAMPYFNHKAIGNEIIQIGDENCALTSEVIVKFFKTGKIESAIPSPMLGTDLVAKKFGGGSFIPSTISRMELLIQEGEIIIIRGVFKKITYKNTNKFSSYGHYFVGIKKQGKIHLLDGQTGENVIFEQTRKVQDFINGRYKKGEGWFEYLKVR